jgi:MFS family permease
MRAHLRVLRHVAFRNLWLSQTASVVGDRLVIVALALFVTDLTGSATDVGLILGAQTLPFVVFLLIGGVWADRLPRARLMIATDVVRAALHGLLAALIFAGVVEIWHIAAIEVLFGTAEAFFRPAHTGLLPRTVPDAEIQEAQALTNMTNNLAELTGPALATALVLGAGAGWAFLFDAATFVVSALFLARVHVADRIPPAHERRTLLAELAEGFAHVRSRSWLWVTVVVFALAVPLGYAPLFVLGPTVAKDSYDSAALFGIITTLFGAGAVAGALAGLRWRPRRPMLAAFAALAPWPAMVIAFGAEAPVAVVIVLSIATGIGFALFDVLWETAMAERIPAHALSRVSSYDWMGSLVLLPVGFLVAGPAAAAWSATGVMIVGGVLTAVVLALGLVPRQTRTLRRIEYEPGQ